MYCKRCGNVIQENERFCRSCGAPVEEMGEKSICRNCGAELNLGAVVCSNCGMAVDSVLTEPAQQPVSQPVSQPISQPVPPQVYEPSYSGQVPNAETQPAQQDRNGFAIAGLVLSIVNAASIFFCCGVYFPICICGILGIIFSAIALQKKQGSRGLAISGLIIGIVSLIAMLVVFILFLVIGGSTLTMQEVLWG